MSRLFPPINRAKANNAASTRNTPPPSDVHIFDGGGGYYHATQVPKAIAERAILKVNKYWYIWICGSLTPINYSDIPVDVKTTMLLLQLDI